MNPELLSGEDIANILKIGYKAAMRKIRHGEFGEVFKISRKCVRVNKADFESYLEKKKVSNGN